MINLQEIFIVNAAGILILILSMLSRIEIAKEKHFDDKMFNLMIGITLGALAAETLTFVVDGKPGAMIHCLQYLLNGYLFLASCSVGMFWVLYVDYRIYHSIKRVRQRRIFVVLPFVLVAVLVFFDLFGTGFIYSISVDNVYIRGKFMKLPYLVLFYEYAYSIVLTFRAVRRNNHVKFFPVLHFVLPCVAGTVIQGLNYGLSVGWFCVSLAFMLVQIQLNNQNAFVDDLSGLYNRKYYNYVVTKLSDVRGKHRICGIMIDVNGFKGINDCFGHTVGDDAIRQLGKLISGVTAERDIAFRHAGDEFIILSIIENDGDIEKLIDDLNRRIEEFNRTSGKPYQLSLAIGYTVCKIEDFNSDRMLHQMDLKMYDAKAEYYALVENNRRIN